tara:strand:+ start:753 stop:3122 length:2370 start_codon:yes stop_codon:yes gene_type:complete
MLNKNNLISLFSTLLVAINLYGQSSDSSSILQDFGKDSLPNVIYDSISTITKLDSIEVGVLITDSTVLTDSSVQNMDSIKDSTAIKNPTIIDSSFNEDEIDFNQSSEIDFVPNDQPISEDLIFKPQLSVGLGMLTFYGDIGMNNQGYHPMVSRIATTLRLINPLNEFLDVGFYVLFGEISVNERSLTRNLNFKSNIRTGGITFNYNFNQLLSKTRIIEPYIHVGFESIEFLSKTDLKDADGNTYHYWSDGSIKDIDENAPNATNAVDIVRDYTYESDIREQNFDGFGKYAERTFAVPLELGLNLYTGNKLKFRVGTAMHFTFSDLIDGVTDQSVGDRVGTADNDKLLFTHIAMSYDFNVQSRKSPIKPIDLDLDQYLQEDTLDSDGDLIVDHVDKCAKTPLGVAVDEYGCPLDDDLDGVSNTFDQELISMEGAKVNDIGITLSNEDYNRMFRLYKDSTGEFSDFDTIHSIWSSDPRSVKKIIDEKKLKPEGKQLFIVIGSDVEGVSANQLWKKLANKDFQVKESGDSVMYVLGGYDESELANKIKELQNDNVKVQGVVEISENNEVTNVNVEEVLENLEENDLVPVIDAEDQEASFRVQIGAFSRKVSKSVFKGLPNLVSVKGDDGLYRFFSGSFIDKSKAASHKINLSTSGYNDAFIVAFKNGNRITLKEAGFQVDSNYKENIEISSTPSVNAIDSKLVKFRIQVGAYKEKVPVAALDLFLDVGKVLPKRDITSGLTKYYVGKLNNYQEAIQFRDELINKGLEDCFIVGEFNSNIISSKEALNIIGQE